MDPVAYLKLDFRPYFSELFLLFFPGTCLISNEACIFWYRHKKHFLMNT